MPNRKLLLVLLPLLSACSSKQSSVPHVVRSVKKNELNMTFITQSDPKDVASTIELVLFSNDSPAWKGHYKNGKKHGRFITFFVARLVDELKIHRIFYFENGLANGPAYTFYENGRIDQIQEWAKDTIVGYTYHFNVQQRLTCKQTYNSKGKMVFCKNY